MMLPLLAYLQSRYGACTGISFIDSTSLEVCDPKRINQHRVFATDAKRGKLFGDRGYISAPLTTLLFEQGLHLITRLRKNMKNCLMRLSDKLLLRKRAIIESIIDPSLEYFADRAFAPS